MENRNTGYFITVDAPSSASIEVTPTASGSTAISSASSVNVVTNAPGGYKLYLSATNVNLSASGVTPAFTPTSTTTLSDNSWGYSLDQSTWNAVTTSQTQIASADSSNYPNGTNTNVYYGVNANTNMPAATYSTTVTYTAVAEGIPEQYTMQGFTIAQCTAMNADESIILMDMRDGKNYRVVKARDGNCWMADNLSIYNQTVTSADTDIPSGSFTIPDTSNWNTNITNEAKIHVATSSGYEGEVYYNWYSATAGSTATSGTVSTSICPKGWRLPIDGDQYQNKSWAKLMNSYDITTGDGLVAQTSLGFSDYYGYWRWQTGTEYALGSIGFVQSATVDSDADRNRNLRYPAGGNIDTSDDSPKASAFSIRCVLNGTEAEQMQNFTLDNCANMATDSTKTLYDRRNGQQYGIVKARDGNCWMRDNLNIVNMTVSAADSDFTSGTFTIPATSTWNTNDYQNALVHTSSGVGSQAISDVSYYGEQNYNWCSATAHAPCADTSVVSTSICPKNWKLPINGNSGVNYSYAKLLSSYNVTTGAELIAQTSLGFSKYYGYWTWGDGGTERHQGSSCEFWSATPGTVSDAYQLTYSSSTVDSQFLFYKGLGYTLRCVLRN